LRAQSEGAAHEELVDSLLTALQQYSQNHEGKTLPIVNNDVARRRRYLSRIFKADSKNYTDAPGFVREHAYFFLKEPPSEVVFSSGPAVGQHPKREHWAQDKIRMKFLEVLNPLVDTWDHDSLTKAMSEVIEHFDAEREKVVDEEKTKDGAHTLMSRWVWQHLRGYVCWGGHGPSLIETMVVLGPDAVLERINKVEVNWEGRERVAESKEEPII
jgi:glutamyl-tRNA synthetase